MSEPVDLAAGSVERRQQLRDSSLDVLIVFPHSGGELARVLAELEELLVLVDLVDDGSRPLPAPLADNQAAELVGRRPAMSPTSTAPMRPTAAASSR